jgi:hypothetical protein
MSSNIMTLTNRELNQRAKEIVKEKFHVIKESYNVTLTDKK